MTLTLRYKPSKCKSHKYYAKVFTYHVIKITQRAHGAYTTSRKHRCNVKTLHRR